MTWSALSPNPDRDYEQTHIMKNPFCVHMHPIEGLSHLYHKYMYMGLRY
jgi:hypothetical protein